MLRLDKQEKKVLLIAISGVLLQHLVVLIAGFNGPRNWAALLLRGDGTEYRLIYEQGYSVGQLLGDTGFHDPKSNYTFYPLLPGLNKVFSILPMPSDVTAILISSVCVLLTTILLYKFLSKNYSEFIAIAVPTMWVFQPYAIVLISALTEPLFSLLTICVLLAIQRKRELLASVFMVGVCLTRTSGAAVALAVLIYFAVQIIRKVRTLNSISRAEWTLISTSIIGPLLWPAYVANKIGRWDAYFYLAGEQWRSKFDGGRSFILKTIETASNFGSPSSAIRDQFVSIAVIVALSLLAMLIRSRAELLIWLTTAGIIAMAASQADYFYVKQRFLAPAFFLFIPVATWLEPKGKAIKFGTAISFMILSIGMTWWISIYWKWSL